jgi:amino-acid N-acetyltransferase
MIRKALPEDVPWIRKFLTEFYNEGLLMPRTLAEVYGQVRDFSFFYMPTVKIFQGMIAVVALHVCWEGTAEIRSLAVWPAFRSQGIGTKLVVSCLEEAQSLGLRRIFIFTRIPAFFERFEFKKITRDDLPPVAWADCVACPKFPDCDEVPMMRIL